MRLIKDFGIRALLATSIVWAYLYFIGSAKNIPEGMTALVSMAVGFYFGNRSTMDKI